MCRFCPFQNGRHRTRKCPAKSDHPPIASTVTKLDEDMEISQPAIRTATERKAYKGKDTRGLQQCAAPDRRPQGAPGEAFRSIEDGRMEHVAEALTNRGNIDRPPPRALASRPQRQTWVDAYVYLLRGEAYPWDEQVTEEAIGEDFDTDGNAVKLSEYFLHPPPQLTTLERSTTLACG
ncbi:hypothetical protein DL767_000189 [Monosporascus sp. MG133]|nr:hypothetical protein DL767_000189 [Monosporascus sp. MG133]